MELLGLLYQIVIRSFFLMLPLGVAFLAFRRLSLSQTSNAWLYAVAGLFAAFTAAGLLPWAMAISGAS